MKNLHARLERLEQARRADSPAAACDALFDGGAHAEFERRLALLAARQGPIDPATTPPAEEIVRELAACVERSRQRWAAVREMNRRAQIRGVRHATRS